MIGFFRFCIIFIFWGFLAILQPSSLQASGWRPGRSDACWWRLQLGEDQLCFGGLMVEDLGYVVSSSCNVLCLENLWYWLPWKQETISNAIVSFELVFVAGIVGSQTSLSPDPCRFVVSIWSSTSLKVRTRQEMPMKSHYMLPLLHGWKISNLTKQNSKQRKYWLLDCK